MFLSFVESLYEVVADLTRIDRDVFKNLDSIILVLVERLKLVIEKL